MPNIGSAQPPYLGHIVGRAAEAVEDQPGNARRSRPHQVKYGVEAVAAVYYHRQACGKGHVHLGVERFGLLLCIFFIPIQVNSDFAYGNISAVGMV